MTYAIIGSGAIGSALARQFARSNIDVLIANSRGPESLAGLVAELGSHVTPTSLPEALKADTVILAVPFTAVAEAVQGVYAMERPDRRRRDERHRLPGLHTQGSWRPPLDGNRRRDGSRSTGGQSL